MNETHSGIFHSSPSQVHLKPPPGPYRLRRPIGATRDQNRNYNGRLSSTSRPDRRNAHADRNLNSDVGAGRLSRLSLVQHFGSWVLPFRPSPPPSLHKSVPPLAWASEKRVKPQVIAQHARQPERDENNRTENTQSPSHTNHQPHFPPANPHLLSPPPPHHTLTPSAGDA